MNRHQDDDSREDFNDYAASGGKGESVDDSASWLEGDPGDNSSRARRPFRDEDEGLLLNPNQISSFENRAQNSQALRRQLERPDGENPYQNNPHYKGTKTSGTSDVSSLSVSAYTKQSTHSSGHYSKQARNASGGGNSQESPYNNITLQHHEHYDKHASNAQSESQRRNQHNPPVPSNNGNMEQEEVQEFYHHPQQPQYGSASFSQSRSSSSDNPNRRTRKFSQNEFEDDDAHSYNFRRQDDEYEDLVDRQLNSRSRSRGSTRASFKITPPPPTRNELVLRSSNRVIEEEDNRGHRLDDNIENQPESRKQEHPVMQHVDDIEPEQKLASATPSSHHQKPIHSGASQRQRRSRQEEPRAGSRMQEESRFKERTSTRTPRKTHTKDDIAMTTSSGSHRNPTSRDKDKPRRDRRHNEQKARHSSSKHNGAKDEDDEKEKRRRKKKSSRHSSSKHHQEEGRGQQAEDEKKRRKKKKKKHHHRERSTSKKETRHRIKKKHQKSSSLHQKSRHCRSEALEVLIRNVKDAMEIMQVHDEDSFKKVRELVAAGQRSDFGEEEHGYDGDDHEAGASVKRLRSKDAFRNQREHEESNHVLLSFHHLLQELLKISDELELASLIRPGGIGESDIGVVENDTFQNPISSALSHTPSLDLVFSELKPILISQSERGGMDKTVDLVSQKQQQEQIWGVSVPLTTLLGRVHKLVHLITDTTIRVCQRQEWSPRAETCFVSLLEMLERTTMEIQCLYPEDSGGKGGFAEKHQLSQRLIKAWTASGHTEELRALEEGVGNSNSNFVKDSWLLRQICYDVLISTDQWCPSVQELGLICEVTPTAMGGGALVGCDAGGGGVDALVAGDLPQESRELLMSTLMTEQDSHEDGHMAPLPLGAMAVLDKVYGVPLPREALVSSVLRRILPSAAEAKLNETHDGTGSVLSGIRSIRREFTKMVAISSVAEVLHDASALGMDGVGKTTLAAMIASRSDVRKYFCDGVAWVRIGSRAKNEFTYNVYVACLQEVCRQLPFLTEVPLFAELLHTPGERPSIRKRREQGFLTYARETVSDLLHMRRVLIVLDDIFWPDDVQWFQFHSRRSGSSQRESISANTLLITTKVRDLLPAADTVEVDLLSESEAIQLLVSESGQPSNHVMADSMEARSVVRECANHPLAVKSVGRWLSLKHATAGVISSVEEIHEDVARSIEKMGGNMMYEILSLSMSPAVNGEPTQVIKLCLAAFVTVFCKETETSQGGYSMSWPLVPMETAEILFETMLQLEEDKLFQVGSLFYSQRKEATQLIPEALSALGVLRVISEDLEEEEEEDEEEKEPDVQKYVQIQHDIQQEYGAYLVSEEGGLHELVTDAERRWNRAFVTTFLSVMQDASWEVDYPDASREYALEKLVTHMLRGDMLELAAELLRNDDFVRGRLGTMGREAGARQHIQDTEALFARIEENHSRMDASMVMERAYEKLGSLLAVEPGEQDMESARALTVEAGRAHYEIGFSLAEKRCFSKAIGHWELSQELLVSSLGMVEFVAAILFNVGVVFSELNEYEKALASLKQCLRIRGAIHGEEHILYAQTIQKIGDIFLGMSDYNEALESYDWAVDVMNIDPSNHRIDIGNILDNVGSIHYSRGEVNEAMRCFEDALRSKVMELGDSHPELAITYQHIGNCLSDQGDTEEAVDRFTEAIRLRRLDEDGTDERDADILSIEGVLNNLYGNQEESLQCYERSLALMQSKTPHKKEKIAALLHLVGCVYLIKGEHRRAMKLFEESLQTRRQMLGFVHLDVASTLFNMAFLHQTRGRMDKALRCLEEALKIRQLRLPDSEKVALTHEKIGTVAKSIGKSKRAETALEEALRIRRMIHGHQHEAVAAVLHDLGDLMDDLGDFDDAMHYYVDALDIRRSRLGQDHLLVSQTLYSMGYTLHNQDNTERALVCFEEAVHIRKNILGENAKEVGDTLNIMGFLQAKRGELDEALTLLWDALRIRKNQEDNVKVSETLKNIGNVHREKQEFDLATECYEECLRIRKEELGSESEKVADALIALGNVRSDVEDRETALEYYQEALFIRSKVHGECDERVAACNQYIGTLEFRSGDMDKARVYLDEFVRIRRRNDNRIDADYVNVLFIVGNIFKMQGNDLEARKCWTEAYQVFTDIGLEDENPQIAKVMNNLLYGGASSSDGSSSREKDKKAPWLSSVLGISRVKQSLRPEKMPKHRNFSRSSVSGIKDSV